MMLYSSIAKMIPLQFQIKLKISSFFTNVYNFILSIYKKDITQAIISITTILSVTAKLEFTPLIPIFATNKSAKSAHIIFLPLLKNSISKIIPSFK